MNDSLRSLPCSNLQIQEQWGQMEALVEMAVVVAMHSLETTPDDGSGAPPSLPLARMAWWCLRRSYEDLEGDASI